MHDGGGSYHAALVAGPPLRYAVVCCGMAMGGMSFNFLPQRLLLGQELGFRMEGVDSNFILMGNYLGCTEIW